MGTFFKTLSMQRTFLGQTVSYLEYHPTLPPAPVLFKAHLKLPFPAYFSFFFCVCGGGGWGKPRQS